MASNARKELARALRVAFGADNSTSSNRDAATAASFEDYEPSEALLDAIDEWANSSAIQSSTTERDIAKLRETLLEHCFEQGTTADHSSPERATQAKSAFLVVLDRFSSLDSDVVSAREIREVWWSRLILPALTLQDTPSDTIRLGRSALKAAKDMTIKALHAAVTSTTSEADDATQVDRTRAVKWAMSVVRACLRAPNESFAQKNLQSVLVAFGKSHPKHFFMTISELLDKPVEALGLLNNFIRLHPIQAYQAIQTPLFGKLIAMLDSLPVSFPEDSPPSPDDTADKLVWVSSALCTLNMLMPRLPTSLDKLLDRFFIILARCLLWYDAVSQIAQPISDELTEDEGEEEDINDTERRLSRNKGPKAAPNLAPLLDYFTQLYGLFPANLVAFLTSPTRWLQAYYRRMRKRRHRTPSSANLSALGRDALLRPLAAAGGLTTYSSSSTSADEDANATDLPMSGAEEGEFAAQLRKKRTTKSGGRKGQRSKTNKARRDIAAKAKKEKEGAKQKERERRRRATNFLQNAPPGEQSAAEQSDVPFPSSVDADQSIGSSAAAGDSSLPSAISTEARTPKVRIQEPDANDTDAAGKTSDGAGDDAEVHSTDSDDQVSEGSETSVQEIEEDLAALDLEGALAVFDWQRVRELSAPYLSQHLLVPALMDSTEAEFTRNKIRFKKLEASDLVDEIIRTRIPQPLSGITASYEPSTATASVASPPPSSLSASTTMLGMSVDSLPENRQMVMMQSQLIFEIYQKNQLVQRLGSLLRDRIATSGAEADKQNLMHQIRSLKSQLSHSQEKLEQLRHESALSRERLNKYSSDQSNRVEKLRGERQSLNSENNSLKAELQDLKNSITALNEELAESRRECFDLKSEQEYEKQLKEQQKLEEVERQKKEESTKEEHEKDGQGDVQVDTGVKAQPEAKEEAAS